MSYSTAVGNKVREIRRKSERVVDKRRPQEESSNSIVSKARVLAELHKRNLSEDDFRRISNQMEKVWGDLNKTQVEASDADLASDRFTNSWNSYRGTLVKRYGEFIVAAAFARFDGGFKGI